MLLTKGDAVLRDGWDELADEGDRERLRGLEEGRREDEGAEEGGAVRWAEEIIVDFRTSSVGWSCLSDEDEDKGGWESSVGFRGRREEI